MENTYQEALDKVVEHLMDEWGYEGMEEEVKEILKPLQELVEENKKIKKRNIDIIANEQNLRYQIRELEGLKEENKDLECELEDKEDEISDLEDKVYDLEEQVEELEKKIKELEEKIEELEEEDE